MSVSIPPYVVEYFLLGRTREDSLNVFTQDGGIVADVWLAFAKNPDVPQRVLVTPVVGTTSTELAFDLNNAIDMYRRDRARIESDSIGESPNSEEPYSDTPNVSPLEGFVAATVTFDELLRLVLPLTQWWSKCRLSGFMKRGAEKGKESGYLRQAIKIVLGHDSSGTSLGMLRNKVRTELRESGALPSMLPFDLEVLQAAPIAALIGLFGAARIHPNLFESLPPTLNARNADDRRKFEQWVYSNATKFARLATKELARVRDIDSFTDRKPWKRPEDLEAQSQIQKVFLDRKATLADVEALGTIKADAAQRLFDISCSSITWAIIDSGIAPKHPAFWERSVKNRQGRPVPDRSRIKAAYDFTQIELIRNFDIALPPGSAREKRIDRVVSELSLFRGREEDRTFKEEARRRLNLVADQLLQRILPDWTLIEPLIAVGDESSDEDLVSDHGTHVAGILGANWVEKTSSPTSGTTERVVMRGVCPDIRLYDLRVINPQNRASTEYALLAAIEFVQYLNARAGSGTVVHGVNISMSIPHDVRNYACGATPVCVACDRLVNSGVVVVAAAGNRGWNEQEIGFGNFVHCSITDPGNAQQVLTVGATHRQKPHTYGVSYFSSRGPTGDGRIKPDLVAPGEKIQGPVRGDSDDYLDGTSMAAPFVSGAAAMLMARHRELIGDAVRVKKVLCDSATDLGRERYFQGHGLVDVLRAIQSV